MIDLTTQEQQDPDDEIDMRQVSLLVERIMQEDDADDNSLEFYQQKYVSKS